MSAEHLDIDAGDELLIHVAMAGTGSPLTLLHGFTGSTEIWDRISADLETNHRVITLDLPGHGRSSSPADPARYSLRRFADDLAFVLDQTGVERTALLGYSMGGRAALHFAVAHPARVSALILVSTSPGLSEPALRDAREHADEKLAQFIEREGIVAFVDSWERLPLWESQQSVAASARSSLRVQRLRSNPQGLANSLRGAGQAVDPLSATDLSFIEAPTLLIVGALDAKYVGIARSLATDIRNARTAVIPDAGHAVHLERPEAVVKAARDFLSDLT